MKLRVLGCSGSIAQDCRTTAFLLDERVLVDAGSGVGDLTLDELTRIDHILVSHSHLDHVLGIPLLADSVMKRRLAREHFQPLKVYGLPPTLDALRRHVFNNIIWPDFTVLPTADRPILELVPISVGQQFAVAGLRVEVLPAFHTVPACGFGVETGSGWWVYTGDTGPNPALWTALGSRPLAQLVIETAFGDEDRRLAQISRHLSPSMLREALSHLAVHTAIAITHIKPGERAAVTGQIAALGLDMPVKALQRGDRFEF